MKFFFILITCLPDVVEYCMEIVCCSVLYVLVTHGRDQDRE